MRMTSIDIQLDGDGCWRDLGDFVAGELTGVALLPDASVVDALTGERKRVPAMTLRVQLPDGGNVLALVKVEMMGAIVGALRGRLDYLAELKARGGAES